jgi:hypothetical protein
MKAKYISILLFILVFAGVTLLGNTQARAAINLFDCECSTEEIAKHLCFDLDLNGDDDIDYVVQVYVEGEKDPDIPGEWPIPYSGNLTWQYRACVPDDANCRRVPTWNYFVERMSDCVQNEILYSVPPGANLVLPGDVVPKCTDFFADLGQIIVKWNPSFNCEPGTHVVFSLTTTSGVPVAFCNEARVTTKKGCDGDFILGPGCDQISTTSFTLGSFSADLDECTGEPIADTVSVDGGQTTATEVMTWFSDDGCNPIDSGVYDPVGNPDGCIVYPLTNTGPTTGCVFRSNPSRGCIGSRCFR